MQSYLKRPGDSRDVVMVTKKEELDSQKMPPPPAPVLTALLEPEVNALAAVFKNSVIKTGQIYRFFADTRRLGIQKNAPNPPQSLTASLGRDIEKFDQLCDFLDSEILHAITVLQRDLTRQQRAAQEKESANAESSEHADLFSPTDKTTQSPELSTQTLPGPTPSNSPPVKATNLPGRRQSTISLSSLNRPRPSTFPLKLDLSAASLRLTAEEAQLFSAGIHSPVTLAPRSARPIDYPPDLMAAFVSAPADPSTTIDLTTLDTTMTHPPLLPTVPLDGSVDKPIELDLDSMAELFGDAMDGDDAGEGLFSPVLPGPPLSNDQSTKADETFLNALGVGGDAATSDLFASLGAGDAPSVASPSTFFGPQAESLDPTQQSAGSADFDFGTLGLDFLQQDMDITGMDLFGESAPAPASELSNPPGNT